MNWILLASNVGFVAVIIKERRNHRDMHTRLAKAKKLNHDLIVANHTRVVRGW